MGGGGLVGIAGLVGIDVLGGIAGRVGAVTFSGRRGVVFVGIEGRVVLVGPGVVVRLRAVVVRRVVGIVTSTSRC